MFANKYASLVIIGVVLAACASELDRARRAKPMGDSFSRALSSGYLLLAENEQAEQNYKNAEYMARRAISSANGIHPSPDETKQAELDAARARLISSLASNARITTPETAAEAQVAYDCWVLKSTQNDQDARIACRRRFETAMGLIPGSATIETAQSMVSLTQSPVLISTQPVISPEDLRYQKPVPAIERVKTPGTGDPKQEFLIYFEFDSATITPEAQDIVSDIIAELSANEYRLIRIEGYSDRAGPASYNKRLSEKRAAVVNQALLSAFARLPTSTVTGYGERNPAKSTADGIREVLNRRTEIYLF